MADDIDLLVRRIRAGETESYAELIRRFERPVWRVVAAMLQDFHTSREMLQQVFVNAYLHLDQFQLGRDFELWIKEIARNCVRQELRRQARQSARVETYRRSLESRWADDGADQRYLDALAACRERLAERSAQAVTWRYEQGHTFDEIAARLATTRNAAEKLLSRIRGLLRQCVEERLSET